MTIIGLIFKLSINNSRNFGTISKKISSKCLHDITLAARQNKLSPIVGRDIEIRRCIDILCRKTKNNVILLGDPGVGKTAIVEALAHRIIKGNVPESLIDCKILSIDMGCLFARSDDNTNIDTKLRNIISDARSVNGILFIDEAHLMLSKNYDWVSVLKPELSNGDIKCIAATTNSEYRRYFIRDKALQRRFQPLYIDEPTQSSTIEILKSLRPSFEYFHSVLISEESLAYAVALSNRYIKDRFDPDKSIDLLDEACSTVKNRSQLLPESADKLQSKLQSLVLQGRNDEVDSIRSEIGAIESDWSNGKIKYNELRLLIKSYYEAKSDELEAMRSGKLEDVGKLRFEIIPNLESQISNFMESNSKYRNYFAVDPADIANVLSSWINVPISSISGSHLSLLKVLRFRLLDSFSIYSKEIERLITTLTTFSTSRNGISVVGISGDNDLDKDAIISVISETLSNSTLEVDLSEYGERHSVSKVIGPPPGYVGYEYGGQLSELIKNSYSTCITIHNANKCHYSVSSLLCGSIKRGYIRDSRGEVISLCNRCIIFNVNSAEELGNFNAVLNEVITINGRPSKWAMERLVNEYCNQIGQKCNIIITIEDGVIDYILGGDYRELLANLKKFVSKIILSPDSSNPIPKEVTVGVNLGEYVSTST